ncbi:MAG: MoaD/ThiS family protein [Acinetobacter populi]|jgi:molybdopterin synthase sulfur carrier subunit|uniref:MoaD/ThiS family protein n=1 Tax=Acinetobacter populi TaxID=1582270 RepID=UPI002354A62B|nr:MoaD/ThiS family protein [Acinetobacter populi]MCH4247645.1 MoaD/ThiS family protein [Acinetobacter populi]
MSQVTFEFYGVLADVAETTEYTLEIKLPTLLADALATLVTDKPQIEAHLERCACAIGDSIVHRDTVLSQNTLVALLPPVAGG